MAALVLVAAARREQQVIAPNMLAAAVRDMAKLPENPFSDEPVLPRAAAKRTRAARQGAASFEVRAVWLEFFNWRRSAPEYASAIQLWGEAASVTGEAPWPPKHLTLCVFCTLFRSSVSLGCYLSHLRSALRLLRAPAAELADTSRLVRGAEKAGAAFQRPKVWASTSQTRDLIQWASHAERRDLALSWVVARHFCLRFSETLALGSNVAPFRFAGRGEKCEVIITFRRRKCYKVAVDVTRKCACTGQRHILCGVCALREAVETSGCPFGHISYAEALAS